MSVNNRPSGSRTTNTSRALSAVQKKQAIAQQKKRFLIKVIILVAELLAIVGLLIWFLNIKLNKIDHQDLGATKSELVNKDLKEETAQVLEGYLDLAIFGVDNRSNGDTESGNSDVIMICSINKDTKKIKLVSVYRDTFCDTDVGYDTGINFHKINRAYAVGGYKQAMKVLNANLDLDIEHFVTVDFNAVTDLVNLVGGIDVELTDVEVKRINHNIKTTGKITGKTSGLIQSAGVNHLDGTQATAYCRIRYTAGNDYRRTQRQRKVLTEVFKKAKKSDLETINRIVDTIFPEISTDMNNMEILKLAADIANFDIEATAGYPFNKYATDFGGSKGDVVCAADWKSNVRALHDFLYDNKEYTPSDTVETYNRLLTDNYDITIDKGDEATKFINEGITFDDFENGGAADAQ